MMKSYTMQWSIYWKLERLSRNPEMFNFRDKAKKDLLLDHFAAER